MSYKNTIRRCCYFNPAVKAYVNLLRSREFDGANVRWWNIQPVKRSGVFSAIRKRARRADKRKFSRDLDRQPEKFSRIRGHLKNSLRRISWSGTFTEFFPLTFSRVSAVGQCDMPFEVLALRKIRIFSRGVLACLAFRIRPPTLYISPGRAPLVRKPLNCPSRIRRLGESRGTVNRSYINYVYVALSPTLLRDARLVPDSHLTFDKL